VSDSRRALPCVTQVLTAITAWCQHNSAQAAFADLFGAVRLEALAPHELHICAQHDLLAAHPDALERVAAALADAEAPQGPPGKSPRKRRRAAARHPTFV
jgi:hypothetical protein